MSLEKDYYEEYWRVEGAAPPDTDPLAGARLKRFLEAASQARTVLDLGCGNGRGTRVLASSNKRAVGLDISHRALARARKEASSIDFLQGDCAAALPFASESFDAVYSAELIEHVFDPQAMVRECHRVLKRAGILFLTTPYHGLVKNLAIALVGFERHFDVAGPHIRFFTKRSLCNLLRRNGFAIQAMSYFGRCWPLRMNMAVSARKTIGAPEDQIG